MPVTPTYPGVYIEIDAVRHADVAAAISGLNPGWSRSGDLHTLDLTGLNDNARFISIIVDGDGPGG